METNYLSKSEAAVFLGVSLATIHRWIAAGFIPSIRIGRTVRIPFSGLLQAVAVQPQQQPQQ